MTKDELTQKIAEKENLIERMRKENREIEEKMQVRVKEVELSNLELAVMQEMKNSVFTGIKYAVVSALSDSYNSPIKQIAQSCIVEHNTEIREIINNAVKETITDKEFLESIRKELVKKLAREMINAVSGNIESAISLVRQDPAFKANVVLRVTEILEGNKK